MAPPQLRGFLRRQLYRDIVTAVTLGWVAGAGWWFGVAIPRRKQYEDFYRNYDANAVAESMKASFEEGRWALFRMISYNYVHCAWKCRRAPDWFIDYQGNHLCERLFSLLKEKDYVPPTSVQ